jgi:hypothetical protein
LSEVVVALHNDILDSYNTQLKPIQWSTKSKIFIIWPFIEDVLSPPSMTPNRKHIYIKFVTQQWLIPVSRKNIWVVELFFFLVYYFNMKQCLTDFKTTVIQICYWVTWYFIVIFWKIKKKSLWFQRKQMTIWLSMIKFDLSNKIRIIKTSATVSLTDFLFLEKLPDHHWWYHSYNVVITV